jgi:hypothetical protein
LVCKILHRRLDRRVERRIEHVSSPGKQCESRKIRGRNILHIARRLFPEFALTSQFA